MMLRRLLAYPYGNTQARAMLAGLPGPETLRAAAAAPERSAALALLGEGFGLSLNDQEAEGSLRRAALRFGTRIARALPGAVRALLEAWLRRGELENLCILCRQLLTGGSLPGPPPLLPTDDVAGKPVELLRRAESLEELAALLAPHPLAGVLLAGRDAPPEVRLRVVEDALAARFWAGIEKRLAALTSFDRAAATEIFALRGDVEVLRRAQRGVAAGLSAEAILAALPPARLLAAGRLESALRTENPAAVLAALLPPGEGSGELRLLRHLRRSLLRVRRAPPFDVSLSLAAVLLMELALRDALALLGGLRLRLPAAAIEAALVCAGGPP